MSVLADLGAALTGGSVRVIDLSQTLSPRFPQIVLPPEFDQCAPFRMEEISRYDDRGPGWYWNNLSFGEHTGTHFGRRSTGSPARPAEQRNRYSCRPPRSCAGLRDRLLGRGGATRTSCSRADHLRLVRKSTAGSHPAPGC